jgi:hypothetical protein
MSDILKIFKVRVPRINYIFKDGSLATFVPRTDGRFGQYLTKDPVKIAELEHEAKQGHLHIFIDPEEYEVEEHLADPAVAMREQIADLERTKLIELLGDPNQLRGAGIDPEALKKLMGARDFGQTAAKPQLEGISNSVTTAATSAESNAGAAGAKK